MVLLALESELVDMAIWLVVLAAPGLVTFVMVARILWLAGTLWVTVQVSELPVEPGAKVPPMPWPVVRSNSDSPWLGNVVPDGAVKVVTTRLARQQAAGRGH